MLLGYSQFGAEGLFDSWSSEKIFQLTELLFHFGPLSHTRPWFSKSPALCKQLIINKGVKIVWTLQKMLTLAKVMLHLTKARFLGIDIFLWHLCFEVRVDWHNCRVVRELSC